MKKINKKEIVIYILICLFIFSKLIYKEVNNLDEIWNFNFANCISKGLIPYRDFNMIQGPLISIICAFFLKIFGQEMIIIRIITIFFDGFILILIYKIMTKIDIKEYLKYIVLIVLMYIMKNYYTIDYNWGILLLITLLLYIEISNENNWKKSLLIGLLAGISITIKQTIGLCIIITVAGYKVFNIKKIKDIKEYLTEMIIRIIGSSIIIGIFFIILFKLGIINHYIDYCIKGVLTFSNKIQYTNLIKQENIIIRILSLSPILINAILLYFFFKHNNKICLQLIIYSLLNLILVYPISDETHFVVAIPITVVNFAYIINYIISKMDIPFKEEKFLILNLEFIVIFMTLFSVYNGIKNYKNENINMELKHFKYLPINTEMISNIKEVDEFIKQNDNVYILDATAAIYMIPIDRYNKNYDMFLIGNLGSKNEEGQIEILKESKQKKILIKGKSYARNWQNPEKVRKYIIENMKNKRKDRNI